MLDFGIISDVFDLVERVDRAGLGGHPAIDDGVGALEVFGVLTAVNDVQLLKFLIASLINELSGR